jgi:hypothetical protein
MILTLVPNRTPSLQLYTRQGATVGLPIPGVVQANTYDYNFDLGANVVGDFEGLVSGVSVAPGSRFPIRDGQHFIGFTWDNIPVGPAGPPPGNTLSGIRTSLINRIAEVTSKPKPNYEIDGQKVSWQQYLDSLFAALKTIDEKLVQESGPYEYVSRGVT